MSRDDDNKNSRLRVLPTYFLRTKPTSENALHARFLDVRFGCLENYGPMESPVLGQEEEGCGIRLQEVKNTLQS